MRRRVRVPELTIGLIVISGSVFAALLWSRSVTETTSVVVAAGRIGRGDVLDEGDIVAVDVRAGADAGLLSADRIDEIVGMVALVDLPDGSPILAAMVGSLPRPTDDEALTAVAIERGGAPTDLAVGDAVRVVVVPDPSVLDGREPWMLPDVVVVRGIDPADEYDTRAVVTLGIPVDAAADVAAASDVRLVRVER